MTVIDKRGERQVCDRCHRVRVKIKRGSICEDCRGVIEQARRGARDFYAKARAVQDKLRERRAI